VHRTPQDVTAKRKGDATNKYTIIEMLLRGGIATAIKARAAKPRGFDFWPARYNLVHP